VAGPAAGGSALLASGGSAQTGSAQTGAVRIGRMAASVSSSMEPLALPGAAPHC
jgi:hypothetical protein